LNAIQDYQIETVEIAPAKIKYIEAAQEKIDIEITQVITLMKELSLAGIIDVKNEAIQFTAISNPDFYRIRFMGFRGLLESVITITF
tara:strand:+ start:805 stop:1065 length:261 start_codon:yes stop_codon:yes gene_type:complete